MSQQITVNNTGLVLKHYDSLPVITFEEIDMVHQRVQGSARKNFQNNREHFIEGIDYFLLTLEEYRDRYNKDFLKKGGNPNVRKTLLTETGYYLLAKTFKDALAWDVQRALSLTYFNTKKEASVYEYLRQIVDLLESQSKGMRSLEDRIQTVESRVIESKQLELELLESPEEPVKLISNTELAMRLGLYSEAKQPHNKLIKAIANAAGLKVFLKQAYEDDFIKIDHVMEQESVKLVSFPVYYKPFGIEKIVSWFNEYKKYAYFEEFYVKNSKYHKAGELKMRGYRIGKKNFRIA